MPKRQPAKLAASERDYPGITAAIRAFADADNPPCPKCASADVAQVRCGVIGRSIRMAAATTKLKLVPNGPVPGAYFCNRCQKYFG